MNKRFLWNEGDLVFSKSDRKPTQEELDKANKAIDEVIEAIEERCRTR